MKDGPTNEPVIDRPPVNADLAPVPEGLAPPTVDAEGTPQTRIGRFKLPTATLRAYTMLFALVVIWLFLQWATVSDLHPYGLFLDPVNFSKLLKQTAVTGILAVGMLMVIVAGQIDLSVGSLVGLVGGIAAIAQGSGILVPIGSSTVPRVRGLFSSPAAPIVLAFVVVLIVFLIVVNRMKLERRVNPRLFVAILTTLSSGVAAFYAIKFIAKSYRELLIPLAPAIAVGSLVAIAAGAVVFELIRRGGWFLDAQRRGWKGFVFLAVISTGLLAGLMGGLLGSKLIESIGWADWQGWTLVVALGSPIAVGLVIGVIHGSLVSFANIPAFIVTLGGLLAWRGVILWLMKGETVTVELPTFRSIGEGFIAPIAGIGFGALAIAALIFFTLRRNRARRRHGLRVPGNAGTVARIAVLSVVIGVFIYMMNTQGGVPIPVFVFMAVAVVGVFLTQNTTFGRYLYAVGGNPDAARLSGISLRKHILLAFCLMGALAGLGALVYTARNGSAAGDAGSLMELDAIAACVIGGTSLMGGRGTVFGACLGALIMASLDNGMSLLNVQNEIQMIVKGAVLVAAVGFDMMGRKRG